MNSWAGLWNKEWEMMKSWLYATMIITLLIVTFVSFALSILGEGSFDLSSILGSSLMMCLLIAMCVPIALLLNSLWIEWRRPDIWLHSSQSIYRLIGSKVLFSLVVGLIGMSVPVILLIVYAVVSEASTVSLSNAVTMIFSFITFYIAAVVLMFFGLFQAAVFRVIRSYVNRGAFLLWSVVLLASIWLIKTFLESSIYYKIAHVGLLPISKTDRSFEIGNLYVSQHSETIYMGEIFLVTSFLIAFFFLSSWLLEKKVRL